MTLTNNMDIDFKSRECTVGACHSLGPLDPSACVCVVQVRNAEWTSTDAALAYPCDMKVSPSLVLLVGAHILLASFPVQAADPLGNWSQRVTGRHIQDVAFGNGVFVTVGFRGILTSRDGVGWSFSPTWHDLLGIIYDNENERFIGVGSWPVHLGAYGSAGISKDGEVWTVDPVWSVGLEGLTGAAYGNGTLVAVQQRRLLISTTDFLNWTPAFISPVYNVAFGNNHFVAVGSNGLIQTSADGVDWAVVDSGVTNSLADIVYANDKFVAVGHRGTILRSSDGSTWDLCAPPATNIWRSVAFGAGVFVAAGKPVSSLISSTDGESWQLHATDLPLPPIEDSRTFLALTYGNGTFAGVISTYHSQQYYSTVDLYQSASVIVKLNGSISSDLSSIQLTGQGGLDRAYLLQESTNLTDWTDLLVFTNSAPTNVIINSPFATASQRFFRSSTLARHSHGTESQTARSNNKGRTKPRDRTWCPR
ncbi:MAG: hypothetical protein KF833_13380 [Verrucomicrobiae bacterium]|nr:hypothetical protein [Verrucomicrobiae bacterium]